MRVLAVIPARGGSKRLPGKNTRALLQRPLIGWSIDFARSIAWFDEVHVSTDSDDIAAAAMVHGAPAPRKRPARLATDEASTIDVVLDVLDWYDGRGIGFDAVALLQPTSPVRLECRWDAARRLLEEDACDAVIGVGPAITHPYLVFRRETNGLLSRWDPAGAAVTRVQDMPPAYQVNGALYLARTDMLRSQRTFFPARCGGVVCEEPVENIDIDTPDDWERAQSIVEAWTRRP